MFRLFKHYVPHAVVWLALIEFFALLDHHPHDLRARHCHDDAYVAVVHEGG